MNVSRTLPLRQKASLESEQLSFQPMMIQVLRRPVDHESQLITSRYPRTKDGKLKNEGGKETTMKTLPQ
jgi:hypothetical protein